MTRLFIPFLPEFIPLIRDGKKTCTARTKRYGASLDVVDSPAGPLLILLVKRIPLSFIRDHYWEEEGVSNPDEFVRTWERLHPRAGFDGKRLVWLHVFQVATP